MKLIKNNFKKLEEKVTACNFSETMKEKAMGLAVKTKKEPYVLSEEDQEIKQLIDRRKILRKKENSSEKENV